ncbi:hypothetical protein [Mycolicibacterium helvum]|nr:hypothetical protein [Mycolicibacterium helvum]
MTLPTSLHPNVTGGNGRFLFGGPNARVLSPGELGIFEDLGYTTAPH